MPEEGILTGAILTILALMVYLDGHRRETQSERLKNTLGFALFSLLLAMVWAVIYKLYT